MSSESGDMARPRSVLDSVAHVMATSFGVGYAPIAPGTLGSIVGVGLFWWSGPSFIGGLVVAGVVIVIGVWSASRMERIFGEHDPSRVVIDEVAGQFVTLWLAWSLGMTLESRSLTAGLSFWLVGFALFRVFDIIKPAPIRRLERMKGGVGIVADDVMAGIYAGLTLHLVHRCGIL